MSRARSNWLAQRVAVARTCSYESADGSQGWSLPSMRRCFAPSRYEASISNGMPSPMPRTMRRLAHSARRLKSVRPSMRHAPDAAR